jgi:hypothetical protein
LIHVLRRPLLGRVTIAELAALALLGVFLATIEAFGTGQMSPGLRQIYWQMALIGGGVIAAGVEMILTRLIRGRPILFSALQLLVMTLPITAWVSVIPVVFFGPHATAESFVPLLPDVLTVNIAIIVAAVAIRRLLTPHARAPVANGAAPPAIREKLPPRLGRSRLIAVQAEDHYLRIRTEAGSDLVLMRFSDALDALTTSDGFQTHRSWWVARGGVETARWKAGRGELLLSDGATAPVSRTYAAALKGTDWAAPVSLIAD